MSTNDQTPTPYDLSRPIDLLTRPYLAGQQSGYRRALADLAPRLAAAGGPYHKRLGEHLPPRHENDAPEAGLGRGNEADVSETKQGWREGPWFEREEDANRAAVNAMAGVRLASDAPGTVRALIVAAQQSLEHLRELEEAWRRGVISEHDGKGGLRSNTNAWRANALRDALAAFVTEVPDGR